MATSVATAFFDVARFATICGLRFGAFGDCAEILELIRARLL